ncbi:MAG: hypothetical protein ACOCPR_04920, partial [Guyparkeria sp.]
LQDDNFATIRDAVEEGRGIFENVRKFVNYLVSTNTGEVLVVFLGVLLGGIGGVEYRGVDQAGRARGDVPEQVARQAGDQHLADLEPAAVGADRVAAGRQRLAGAGGWADGVPVHESSPMNRSARFFTHQSPTPCHSPAQRFDLVTKEPFLNPANFIHRRQTIPTKARKLILSPDARAQAARKRVLLHAQISDQISNSQISQAAPATTPAMTA